MAKYGDYGEVGFYIEDRLCIIEKKAAFREGGEDHGRTEDDSIRNCTKGRKTKHLRGV